MNPIKNKEPVASKIWADWDKKSKLLRRRFPQLVPSDLKFEKGNENDLLEGLQNKLKKNKSQIIQIIENTLTNKFINNLKINYHE